MSLCWSATPFDFYVYEIGKKLGLALKFLTNRPLRNLCFLNDHLQKKIENNLFFCTTFNLHWKFLRRRQGVTTTVLTGVAHGSGRDVKFI